MRRKVESIRKGDYVSTSVARNSLGRLLISQRGEITLQVKWKRYFDWTDRKVKFGARKQSQSSDIFIELVDPCPWDLPSSLTRTPNSPLLISWSLGPAPRNNPKSINQSMKTLPWRQVPLDLSSTRRAGQQRTQLLGNSFPGLTVSSRRQLLLCRHQFA